MSWPKLKLIEEMTRLQIPFSEILSVKQLMEEPEVSKMSLVETIQSERYQGELKFPKSPVHYSRTPVAKQQEPPLLGEHTHSVLSELLGYSDTYIEELRLKRVI